ncbi:hypothetical protein BYT27DRAFT_7205932, partial [Phlegmacium glaucopus]
TGSDLNCTFKYIKSNSHPFTQKKELTMHEGSLNDSGRALSEEFRRIYERQMSN